MLSSTTLKTTRMQASATRSVAVLRHAPISASTTRISRTRVVSVKASLLKVGDSMTDSSEYYRVLRKNDGGSVALSSFKDKQPVVLFFYPKAATPGCTKEACKFRDEYERFTRAGAVVYGISSDSPEDNDKFAKAQRLQFPLLTDQGSILRKTFGIKADLMGLLPGRQTYVIDKNGKVILSFNDAFNAEGHVDAALKALNA